MHILHSHLIDSLNSAQQSAVTAAPGHLLVLAGAGSGKTRVLVHRIAWLIQACQLSPYHLLAVTFTNKAAAEMRSRIHALLGDASQGLWVGTFHGIAHRLLRLHAQAAQLSENFQIIDSDDQLRILKRIIKNKQLDDKQWPAKVAQWFINQQKDIGLMAHQVENDGDLRTPTLIEIYRDYELACSQSNLIDFADLILKTHGLWLNHPELQAHYQQRFQHILVDEFQDTNRIQYAWLRLLIGDNNYLTVVGDDDQSIYGWRGAQIDNLHRFTKEYPQTHVVRLEENYRSTQTILEAANALIDHNDQRLGKDLWTAGAVGEPIHLYHAFNEVDEARFVGRRLLSYLSNGYHGREIAILYRSNAQSRVIEDTLLALNIPYRIHGGLRFFERAEIKDALAYLQLINNRHNNSAFDRIINVPARRIGERTLATISEYANTNDVSFWQAAVNLTTASQLSKLANQAVLDFITLIDAMAAATFELPLGEQAEYIIEHSGLRQHYAADRSEKGRAKLDNLLEFINATTQFTPLNEDDYDLTPLAAFLAHASLEAGESTAHADDCVQLMTLHAAKGLEFPIVFMVGLEEGLFPSFQAISSEHKVEEERRLCYVGMTRAMQQLFLSYAQSRFLHGETRRHAPSRFLREIPSKYLKVSAAR